MVSLKEVSRRGERLAPGHRLCAGCGAGAVVRQILLSTETPIVVSTATGCLEVSTTIFPYTSWRTPWIHCAFENAASTISGVESMYQVLRRRGLIKDRIKFLAFGGDGGTYDIGFQALSGALERGHDIVYVCYDNEAYMNTGIQRSGATPKGAWTTTSPSGEVIPGKKEHKKNLTEVVAAHNIPYVAQSTPAHFQDLLEKARKAIEVDGPAFLNVLSPCPRGWRFPADQTMHIAREAVKCCYWPTYEVEEGEYRLTGDSAKIAKGKLEKTPVEEYMRKQGRCKHLFTEKNKHIIEQIQKFVDKEWEKLLAKAS